MAISSTCNLPNSASIEDVHNIYIEAYKQNLKGITIYRDGSNNEQLINFGNKKIDKEEEDVALNMNSKKRPIKRSGDTIEIATPNGNLFVTCNYDDTKLPIELFFRVGKQGANVNVFIDALGRVCSKALQYGVPITAIIDTLRGLQAEKFWFKLYENSDRASSAESIVDAIAIIMENYFTYNKVKEIVNLDIDSDNETDLENCPVCGIKSLKRSTGCRGGICLSCNYTSCG